MKTSHRRPSHKSYRSTRTYPQYNSVDAIECWNNVHDFVRESFAEYNGSPTKALSQHIETLIRLSYPISNFTSNNKQLVETTLLLIGQYLEKYLVDELLTSKWCHLIVTVVAKYPLAFDQAVGTQLAIILCSLIQRSNKWLLVDSLRALSYTLYDLVLTSDETLQQIVECLLQHARLNSSDPYARRYAINCLGSLCNVPSSATMQVGTPSSGRVGGQASQITLPLSLGQSIVSVLTENFENYSKRIFVDKSLLKLLSSTVSSISAVVKICPKAHISKVDVLVTRLKRLVFFGTRIAPTSFVGYSDSDSDSGSTYGSTSDSGSASDGVQQGGEGSREAATVRIDALQLIATLARADFKSLSAYWKHLVPSDESSIDPHPKFNPTLCTVLLFDPSGRCRSAAAQALSALLDNSKPFLAYADDTEVKSAFIPFSVSLANMILYLHAAFDLSLREEKSSVTLLQSLRALNILVDNVPYEKLPSLSKHVKSILYTLLNISSTGTDRNLYNASLSCLCRLLGTRSQVQAIDEYLSEDGCKLLSILLSFMHRSNSAYLRTEAAYVLGSAAGNYARQVSMHWTQLLDEVQHALRYTGDQTLRFSAIEIVRRLTDQFENVSDAVKDDTEDGTGKARDVAFMTETMWKDIFELVLRPALKDSFLSVRAAACALYAGVLPSMHRYLGSDFKEESMQDLEKSALGDEAPVVRATAAKTIGIFIYYPHLKEDTAFVYRCISIVRSLLKDPAVTVRARAGWVLATLCDSVRSLPQETEKLVTRDIALLILDSCSDTDKVLCNVVRALGVVASFVDGAVLAYHAGKDGEITIQAGMFEALLSSLKSKTVKVRWNACYALASLLSNKNASVDVASAVRELCSLLQRDANFKVRIQAGMALSSLPDLKIVLGLLWKSHILALADLMQEENRISFREYKYVSTLKQYLARNICGLIQVTSDEDVAYLDLASLMDTNYIVIMQALEENAKTQYDEDPASDSRRQVLTKVASWAIGKETKARWQEFITRHCK